MGISRNDLVGVRIIVVHPGAVTRVTYFVDGEPLCFRQLSQEGKEDQFCSLKAGHGTGHLGIGACKYHYGNLAETNLAKYGKYLKGEFKERYADFAQDESKLLDLYPELAMLRTMLTSAMDMYQDTRSARALELILRVMQDLGNTVERIDRIQSRQVLTAAMAKMMFAKALQIAQNFVEPDKLPAFVEVWRTEVAGLIKSPEIIPVIDVTPKIEQFVEEE